MKRNALKICIIALVGLMIMGISGCSNNNEERLEELREMYLLPNGYLPSETEDMISDALLNIYMPFDEENIIEGVEMLAPIATEQEIEDLKSEAGSYDESRRATIKNMQVSVCMPENSTDNKIKYLATFTLEAGENASNMLIEFGCNTEGMIDTHSIWVNNNVD